MGGWKRTRGLSWRSTLGPRPSAGTAPVTWVNGSAGPSMSPKKNAATAYITSVAQPTSRSSARDRNRQTMAVAYPPRMTPHSRIEPARADHIPVIE